MKNRANSKTKRRRDAYGVSLFPFLAVLICTMGVLILLLVILTHQARLQAAEEAIEQNIAEENEASRRDEDARRRVELLRKNRLETEKQITEIRLRLGIIEDHCRKLVEELRRLVEIREQLERSRSGGRRGEQLEAELAETKANIAMIEAEIEKTRREIKRQKRSFRPIIPYKGPGGTMRIPICVECRGDSVVLQPEGIALTEEDFDGPLDPGNPLAAALRAAREYLLSSMGTGISPEDMNKIEPYPLLLVRPEGTHSYRAAMLAIKSWGAEFGYELVEDDWEIDYGSPRAELAQAMQEAIEAARAKKIRLAAAAPRHYPEQSGGSPSISHSYTTAAGGGGIATYRGPLRKSNYLTPAERLAMQQATAGSDFGSGNNSGDATENTGAMGQNPGGKGIGNGGNSVLAQPENAQQQPGMQFNLDDTIKKQSQASALPKDAVMRPGAKPTESQQGIALRPGEWRPSEPRLRPGKDQQPEAKPGDDKNTRHKPGGLATTRGKNWGLPDSATRSTPLPRPISIQCRADRLVIEPERGLSGGKEIAIAGATMDSIDEFVSAIWRYMDESWGIAGNRMYWKPILKVEVAADAEGRYEDLKSLLNESGLEVERRGENPLRR